MFSYKLNCVANLGNVLPFVSFFDFWNLHATTLFVSGKLIIGSKCWTMPELKVLYFTEVLYFFLIYQLNDEIEMSQ